MLGLVMSALFANAATFTVTNTNASGAGSLTDAINQANGTVAADVINFQVGLCGTIQVVNLPVITNPLTITGPASKCIIVSGDLTPAAKGDHLIGIDADNVTITNLVLQNTVARTPSWSVPVALTNTFGIIIFDSRKNITIDNCTISNTTGPAIGNSIYSATCTPAGNCAVGVSLITIKNTTITNAGALTVGGVTAGVGSASGIDLSWADLITIDGCNITQCGQHGINFNGGYYATKKGVSNSTVNATTCSNNGKTGQGGGILLNNLCNNNTISGCTTNNNSEHGIWLKTNNDNNKILNNISNNNGDPLTIFIGCGINISLSNNSNNLIKGNTVSSNKTDGIYLYDNYGTNGNDLNFIEANTVIQNKQHGINVVNSNRTVIRNNFIGTDNTYAAGLGNTKDGIYYGNSSTGGEISGNVVINNKENGINITAGIAIPPTSGLEVLIPKGGSNNNYIFNNYVGIDKNGIAKPNLKDGIVLSESFGNNVGRSPNTLLEHPGSLIGGAIVANTRYKNYISGNLKNGISLNNIDPNSPGNILNPKLETLASTIIEGNYIGTNLSGVSAVANGEDGIGTLNSATSKVSRITIIDNLISGNTDDGIQLGGSNSVTAATDLISIQGNTIGMNLAQNAALPNGGHGLNLVSTQNVAIGDPTATGFTAKSNLISGNTLDGIEITVLASDINVYYNRIGTDPTGTSAFPNRKGIWMDGANNNFIVGNLISGNTEDGIYVVNASGLVNPNTIAKNYIGTNQAGTAALANGFNGITLDACNNNKIGTSTTDGNLISGNTGEGISLINNSDANTIDGTTIGLNVTLNGKIPNGKNGILLSTNASNNKIGSVVRNYISGNTENGIQLNGASNNTIAKNIIGLGANDTPYGNMKDGISLIGSSTNTIGGATTADANTIAGNNFANSTFNGISITASSNTNNILNNRVGTLSTGTGNPVGANGGQQNIGILINGSTGNILNANVIGNAKSHGVSLVSANTNTLTANLIGLDINGTGKIPNNGDGVSLLSSNSNNIGGTNAANGNFISANKLNGVKITGTSGLATTGNLVQNNYIGTNKNGVGSTFGNEGFGIALSYANTTQILANVVSKNTLGGISLSNSGTNAGTFNTINSNIIGFDVTGQIAIGNGGNGITLDNSKFNQIGAVGAGNVIGNHASGDGIQLVNTSSNNAIVSNTIGLTKDFSTIATNDNGISLDNSSTVTIDKNTIAGNAIDGIVVTGSTAASITNNTIGTNSSNATTLGNTGNGININSASTGATVTDNIIAKNGLDGLLIDASNNAVVSGNIIGTNAAASTTDLGNVGNGISLKNGSKGAKIGTTNNIAYNQIAVFVDAATTTGNTITQNSIYCNTNGAVPGIQLSNNGNNNYLNPWISRQKPWVVLNDPSNGGKSSVYFVDTALVTVGSTIEYFKKDATCLNCKQGQTYVNKEVVAAFSGTVPATKGTVLKLNTNLNTSNCSDYIITITDPAGNTSQFSTCSECVTLCIPSTVTLNPVSQTACEGSTTTKFTATSSGSSDTYIWQVYDNTLSKYVDIQASNTDYSGITTNTLSITNVKTSMDALKYRIKVFTCGDSVFSNVTTDAILTVKSLPKVTLDPLPTRLCVGGNYTFKSLGTGTGLTYQWQVANKTTPTVFSNVSGETSADYTFSNIPQSADGNIYRVELKGDCPTTLPLYTDTAQLFVDSATSINTQPVDVAICSPGNATFKVDVLGKNTATYQWQESINGGAFANISDGGIYAGTSTTSLTLTNATNALISAKYQLVVTGKCNPITSNAANLTFTTAPTVQTSPVSTPICEDANTTLSGTIKDATSYYWEVSTDNGGTWTTVAASSVYSTVTTSTLTFTKVPLSYNTYQYRLVGVGACTPDAVSSATILTVNEKPKVVNISSITPVCEGATATYTTTATGTSLSFQWKVSTDNGVTFNNIAVGAPYTVTSTANSSTLDIVTSTSLNTYKYQLEVTGTCSPKAVSNDVLLTVNSNPTVTSPADVTMCENATKTMSVTLGGTGVGAQWQIDNGTGYVDIIADATFSGVTSNTLTIKNPATSLNGAKFQVVAKGTCNNTTGVTSANFATLTINTVPVISLQPKNKTVCEGSATGFGVTATGTGLTYKWEVNTGSGFTSISGAGYSGVNSDTLMISSVTNAMNNYEYRVVIAGTCSTVTTNLGKLTVNRSPQILQFPQSATICPGNTVTFTSNALAVAGLTYQWQTDNGTGTFTDIVGANQKDYTTPTVSVATGSFKYQLVVSATCPSPVTTAPVGITLTTAPVITTAPSNASICDGGDANFTVIATNATSYQWSIDGVGILNDDATFTDTKTNSLTVKGATLAQFNGQVFRVTAFGACAPNDTRTAVINFVIPTVDPILPSLVCDSNLTNIKVESTGPGSSGAGTTFVWSSQALSPGVVTNPAVNIPRGSGGKHTIAELLDNTTTNPVVVQYTVTPYKAGCYGNPEVATVIVRPTVYLTLDGPYTDKCIGSDITLTAPFYPNGEYAWFLNGVLLDKDTSNSVTVKVPSEVTEVEVFFEDTLFNCQNPSVIDSIVPIPLTKVDYVRTRLCAGFEATFTPNVPTNALVDNFVWTFGDYNVTKNSTILSPEIGYNFKNAGSFLTKVDAYYKGCKVASYDSTLIVSDCSLQFRNTITPNGDNQNEEFEIGNIDLYPNAEISIFNRWGVIIWSGKNLTVNKFAGLNTSGEVLEDGVYYYVLDLKTGSNKQSIKKGYITLMRTIP